MAIAASVILFFFPYNWYRDVSSDSGGNPLIFSSGALGDGVDNVGCGCGCVDTTAFDANVGSGVGGVGVTCGFFGII